MRKRFLSALLAFCMALTLLPGTALAAEPKRGYYGAKLTGIAQTIYDALCQNVDKIAAGEPVYIPMKRLLGSQISTDQELKAALLLVPDVRDAFVADRPDVFWTRGYVSMGIYVADDQGNISNSYYLHQEYTAGVKVDLHTSASWSTGGRSLSSDMAAVNSKVAALVAEARKQPTVEAQLRYIHDWLTRNNAYNEIAKDTANYIETDSTPWSAVSALGIDSKLAPVCEGYSSAFKLLCDELGIPCVVVSGSANGGGHMWNYVQIGGKWYAVDVTFDDPIPDSGPNATDNTYFLVGKNTTVRRGQTFANSHKPDSDLDYPVLADEKYDPSAPAEKETPTVKANPIEVTVGEKLSNSSITGTASVPGSWVFVDAVPSTAAVNTFQNVKVKFVPTNTTAYNEVEATITVTVKAAPVEKEDPVVKANPIEVTVGEKLSNSSITGTASVPGSWVFVDAIPSTAAVNTFQNVRVKFVPADTTAYNEVVTTITVTVKAAPVVPVAPTVTVRDLTVNYTGRPVSINDVTKSANVPGTWSFVGTVPTAVGTHTVTVRFTPSDTTRYTTIDRGITLTISRTAYTADAEDLTVELGRGPLVHSDLNGTATVAGHWEFVDAAPSTAVRGSTRVRVVFIPDNAAYERMERTITVNVTKRQAPIDTPQTEALAVVGGSAFNPDGWNPRAGENGYYEMDLTASSGLSITSLMRRMFSHASWSGSVYNGNGVYLGSWNASAAVFTPAAGYRDSLLEATYVLVPTDADIEVQALHVQIDMDDEYYISIPRTNGGDVVPSVRYAESGERVTLTAHPDSGWELDGLTVTDIRGREIALRSLGGNSYSFVMPSSQVTASAVFKNTADNTPSPEEDVYTQPFTGLGTPGISGIVLNPATMPFTDVKGTDWFYNHVDYVWKHYLMSGTSDTRFDPNATTTRAMIWTIMARMNNVRTDINPGSNWYEKGMLWAIEKGVSDGSNALGDITREQLATMLWRNAGSPSASGSLSQFSDADSVSAYALNAVRWAAGNGILSGIDGRIEPKGTATRAQVAAMVARYGDKVVR